jgi:hypothetical protein
VLQGLLEAVRFFWKATRGHRLAPWRSPYLRWRMETYTGKPAKDIAARDFWELFQSDRHQFLRFLGWVGEMRGYADGRSQD